MEILLFVNDNILIKTSIQNYLESTGYKVDSCLDGLEALDKFYSNDYDLILLDAQLPVVSGYELVSKVREENEKIPILVFCTAEYECKELLPYIQGSFDQDTNEQELLEKIKEEISKYKNFHNK